MTLSEFHELIESDPVWEQYEFSTGGNRITIKVPVFNTRVELSGGIAITVPGIADAQMFDTAVFANKLGQCGFEIEGVSGTIAVQRQGFEENGYMYELSLFVKDSND